MLRYDAIDPATLGLLKKLMAIPALAGFRLVGGTALALQLGHRISLDIDLFTDAEFEVSEILDALAKFDAVTVLGEKPNSLNLIIDGVRTDLIRYAYPILSDVIVADNIRMLSKDDIGPMKLSAVTTRGAKKDFYDIYFLLNSYSLADLFELFQRKYPKIETFHVLKSLTYFEDADTEPSPQLLEPVTWQAAKERIVRAAREMDLPH